MYTHAFWRDQIPAILKARWLGELFGAALAGLIACSALILHGGIPAYKHDWQWPALSQDLFSWAVSKSLGWYWQSLGTANDSVQIHPFFWLNAFIGALFGSYVALIIVVSFFVALACWGMLRLAGLYVPSTSLCYVAGILFALSPVTVNKIVAGHLAYLAAYACVPLLALAVRRGRFWQAAFWFAWCLLQIQVALLAIIIVMVLGRHRKNLRAGIFPFACVVGTILPYLWALLQPAGLAVAGSMKTSLPWELSQSATLLAALQGDGYFAHYWINAVAGTPAQAAPMIYPLALAALIVRRRRIVIALASIYGTGVALVWGLNGPLAIPMAWSFTHVLAASAFRELYDAAFLITFSASLLAALLLLIIPKRYRSMAAIAITIFFAWPWMNGSVLAQTGTPALSAAETTEIASALQDRPSAAEFLLPPAANPVGPIANRFGGADPLAFPIGQMVPFWSYNDFGYYHGLAEAVLKGGPFSAPLARALGIGAIVSRSNIETKFRANSAFPASFTIQEISGKQPLLRGWHRIWTSSHVEIMIPDAPMGLLQIMQNFRKAPSGADPAAQIPPVELLAAGSDPARGWVHGSDWWFLSPALAAAAGAAVTSSRAFPFTVLCQGFGRRRELALLGQGAIGSVEIRDPNNWSIRTVTCGVMLIARTYRGSFIAVTTPEELRRWSNLERDLSGLQLQNLSAVRSGDMIAARAVATCRKCAVRLSQTYSTLWTMRIDGRSAPLHQTMRGLDNEWPVAIKSGDEITVEYRDPVGRVAKFLAVICWLAVAVGVISETVIITRRRNRLGGSDSMPGGM
ncbi:MAG TPA: hypothetical protein VFW34_08880 [Candidatus Rubrimentiphilum sp.]|nr:hypothetical protein [Candidatus Rubrimentiphilum sp.]